ncbi:hypothetical protein GE061_016025 [Apolygus lucorum]|uniref:Hexosyltransferase n=1 Tax=Apolygus lucorum TaxID=248454 RepID=A0A8S9XH34_APOLU|nr:hypothetical protein GE061_016025 [Apolygus lucorum]
MARRRKWNPATVTSFAVGFILGHLLLHKESCSLRPTFETTAEDLRTAATPLERSPGPEDDVGKGPNRGKTEDLLFVGVMTAQKYLDTRATAVYRTWGKKIPGKIVFFSSEGSKAPDSQPDLPLVALPDVDDSYPPQKKSFLMLQYMWEKYGRSFEWFLRADDDVYIRPDKMESFLRSVDSQRRLFIGQAGRGNQEEFGLLSLEYDENFCMGGPGVIMSRFTLAKVAQNVRYCLKNLYTTHEDVELGRCVQKFAGIPCTWSYEMQTIFYHNGSGNAAFNGSLKKKEIHRAITLHPIKDYHNMYRIHNYFKMLQVREEKFNRIQVQRDILAMASLLQEKEVLTEEESNNVTLLGKPPGLTKFRPINYSELLTWDFLQRSIYSPSKFNPRMKIGSSLQEGLEDVVREVMDMINMYSKQRGRVIDFKEILYGYTRYDPLHGVDYILDMLLVYKKYRGRKMTVPVRRHAYLQQQYTGVTIREIHLEKESPSDINNTDSSSLTVGIKNVLGKSINKLSRNLPALLFSPHSPLALSHTESYESINDKTINFILPLSGRFDTFRRFVQNFETVCLNNREKVSLMVIVFPSEQENTTQRIVDTIRGLQKQYPNTQIRYVSLYENFARARALSVGATHYESRDLLFFIDVDIVWRTEALRRIRRHTLSGASVYYPIVFSEFDPQRVYRQGVSPDNFAITERAGYWRQYGFGICSMYKSDLEKVGGFNTSIVGWGKEDVDLFEKFVKIMPESKLRIFRAPDPDLVHVYHPVTCNSKLGEEQMAMCKASRADSYSSMNLLEEELRQRAHNGVR